MKAEARIAGKKLKSVWAGAIENAARACSLDILFSPEKRRRQHGQSRTFAN
jgi:hypothetical protein